MRRLAAILAIGAAFAIPAMGQTPGLDWLTDSSDAQRSAWIRSDQKISREGMGRKESDGGFQFLWKMKLRNAPRQLNSLTPPATLDRLIGYRGFRMLGFVGGSSDSIYTIDTDLGRMEWEVKLKAAPPVGAGTVSCPGGMTTSIVRPMLSNIPPPPNPNFGRGRRTPGKSDVGQPGQGAVTLALVRPSPPPGPNPMLVQRTRPNPASPPGGQLGAGPFLINALSGDGMFHSLHLSNGASYEQPVRLVPAGANAVGLAVVNYTAYAATVGGCGGAENGLHALDLASKQLTTWKADIAGSVGPAFDGEGTVYATTGSSGENPNSLVALDPKTLKVKASYSAGDQPFTSSPVIFEHKGRTLIAAAAKDGRIHLVEGGKLTSAVATSGAWSKDFAPGALSSWQDADGTRWILAPVDGALPPGFQSAATRQSGGAVVAWKVVEQNGTLALQPGWASRELVSPLTPTIINGVVFAVSSGEHRAGSKSVSAAIRVARSSKAVVYALDGQTGKEIWNSGTTVTSFARGGAISGGMGQIYLTTHDGTIYAFGFPMEH